MKVKDVMFRDDVRDPAGQGLSSGYQAGRPEGLAIEADPVMRVIILKREGKYRHVPFENVRSYTPDFSDEPKPSKATAAKVAQP